MAKENNLKANATEHKCAGIGCAFKQSCGRFLRPEANDQAWASFYASADVDCEAFEAVTSVKG